MRISDWSSDVCSSDLRTGGRFLGGRTGAPGLPAETSRRLHLPLRAPRLEAPAPRRRGLRPGFIAAGCFAGDGFRCALPILRAAGVFVGWVERSETHQPANPPPPLTPLDGGLCAPTPILPQPTLGHITMQRRKRPNTRPEKHQ